MTELSDHQLIHHPLPQSSEEVSEHMLNEALEEIRQDMIEAAGPTSMPEEDVYDIDHAYEMAISPVDPSSETEPSKWKHAAHVGKRALQTGIITLEVLPTNGVITYGVPALVFAATKNVPATMATAGVLTTGLEGLGGRATADILSNSPDNRLVTKIRDLLNSRSVRSLLSSKEGRINPAAEAMLALYGGTPTAMLARESEPDAAERTQDERRRYGDKVSAALGIICTAQMGVYSGAVKGIMDGNPAVYVPAGVAALGVGVGINKVKNHVKAERAAQESEPRYDLSEEEMSLLEADLLQDVGKELKKQMETTGLFGHFRKKKTPEGVYAVWMDPDSRYANIIRTREAEYFPEVKELPPEIEEDTKFLAFVDTREGVNRIVHGTTISGIEQHPSEEHTGFTTIDELIDVGNFTAQEFRDYYAEKGIDISKSVSIDTNFRIGEKEEDYEGLNTAYMAYTTIYKLLERRRPELGDAGAFCSINQKSIDSFVNFGMDCELLMGREDFTTPEAISGSGQYLPAVVRVDDDTRAVFAGLSEKVKELEVQFVSSTTYFLRNRAG